MRADRLISILLLLQNHRRLTAKELAEMLEVSERTIFRDMDALSAAGIPVYAERGSAGGWTLPEGYKTNLTGMKSDEIVSLLLSKPVALLKELGMSEHFEAAFQKLLAATPSSVRKNAELVRERILFDGAGWHQSQEAFVYLPIIQDAVWEERLLQIQYQKEDSIIERVVLPLGIVAKRNIWYMVALTAQTSDSYRTYRISRLINAVLLEENFKRPASFQLETYWEQSIQQFKQTLPRYEATLIIDEKLLEQIGQDRYIKILHSQQLNHSKRLQLVAQFHTIEAASASILSYGSLAEVLEPAELRELVSKTIEKMSAIYLVSPDHAQNKQPSNQHIRQD